MIASTAFYNSPEQVRQRTLEKLVAEDIAREAAKSPMQRRAEREAREAYDRSLTECYFAAIEKHGMDGYDRELDCGHIGERP
ncbi:hypothetical protein [Pseudomonas sp. Marseille-Q5115]|uniref:hypothetical protein n=1 Tax=Pseudomonas sp. Marseille-Q5115 TaxID=2866593 RepID=UPI001CE3DDB9|nr:hypothetical protein [Pseudomonas sp. Marseille-Q5115]